MRFGGIVVAAALVLSACSSDPVPKEPAPTKATTATTPAVAVPTMPPQASEDSPEGAAAFVKHYVDVFNYAAATGDVKELSRISSECRPCTEYAKDFSSLDPSSRPNGDAWKLGDVGVSTEAGNRRVQVSITSLGDDGPFDLLFELSSRPPFQVLDISDRTK